MGLVMFKSVIQALEILGSFAVAVIRPILGLAGITIPSPTDVLDKISVICLQARPVVEAGDERIGAGAEELHAQLLLLMRSAAASPARLTSHPDYVIGMRILDQLSKKAATHRLVNRMASGRVEPVGLMIRGLPGSGKDTAAAYLVQNLHATAADGTRYKLLSYNRNFADQHWSGFQGQGIMVVQDALQAKGDPARSEEALNLIQCISSATHLVSGADTLDKGQPFNARLVVCTSNVRTSDVPCTLEDPSALKRRFNIVVSAIATRDETSAIPVTSFRVVEQNGYSDLTIPVGTVLTLPELGGIVQHLIDFKWKTHCDRMAQGPLALAPVNPAFLSATVRSNAPSAGMVPAQCSTRKFSFSRAFNACVAAIQSPPVLRVGAAIALAASTYWFAQIDTAPIVYSTTCLAAGVVSAYFGAEHIRKTVDEVSAIITGPLVAKKNNLLRAIGALAKIDILGDAITAFPRLIRDLAVSFWAYVQECHLGSCMYEVWEIVREYLAILSLIFGGGLAFGIWWARNRSAAQHATPEPQGAVFAYDAGAKGRRYVRPYKIVSVTPVIRAQALEPGCAAPAPHRDSSAIMRQVSANVVDLEVDIPGQVIPHCHATYLDSEWAITTLHCFKGLGDMDDPSGVAKLGDLHVSGRGFSFSVPLASLDFIAASPDSTCNDYLLIRIPVPSHFGSPRSGIKHLLIPEQNLGGTYRCSLVTGEDTLSLDTVSLIGRVEYGRTIGSTRIPLHVAHALRTNTNTSDGTCGGVWYDVVRANVIGIHVAGGKGHGGYAAPLTSEVLDLITWWDGRHSEPLQAQSLTNVVCPGLPVLPISSIYPGVNSVSSTSRKSAYIGVPNHQQYVDYSNATEPDTKKAQLKVPCLPFSKLTAADCYGTGRASRKVRVLTTTCPDPVCPTCLPVGRDVKFAEDLFDHIYGTEKFPQLTEHQALREMHNSNSPGMPFTARGMRAKSDLILQSDDGTFVAHPMLETELRRLESNLAHGTPYEWICASKMKDELLVEGKNPRIIEMVGVDINVAMALVFGNWRKHMVSHCMDPTSHSACGVNPYSSSWRMYADRFFRRHGFYPIACDCVALDRNIARDVHEVWSYKLGNLIGPSRSRFDIDPEKLLSQVGLLARLIDGLAYRVDMSNPSGNLLTVQNNDFDVALQTCLGIRDILQQRGLPHSLADVLAIYDWVSYGDDIIGCVKISSGIMPGPIQVAATRYGATFTFDDKLDHEVDYIPPLSGITFLKRLFVEENGNTFAPLAKRSILSCLAHQLAVDKEHIRYSARVSSMLFEASLWGPVFYAEIVNLVQETFRLWGAHYAPTGIAMFLPPYERIRNLMNGYAATDQEHVPFEENDIVNSLEELPETEYAEAQCHERPRVGPRQNTKLTSFLIVCIIADTTTPATTTTVGAVTGFVDLSTEQMDVTSSAHPLSYFSALVPGAEDVPEAAISREKTIYAGSWNTAQARDTLLVSLKFPDLLFDDPFIWSKVKYWRMFRAGVEITIRMNGNKFLYGDIVVGWDPATALDVSSDSEINVASMLSGPSLIMGPSDPEAVKIHMPWLAPFPSLDVATYLSGTMGTVDLVVLNQLTSISSASSTSEVAITVTARFTDVVMDVPTDNITLSIHHLEAQGRNRSRGNASQAAKASAEQVGKSTTNLVISAATTALNFLLPLVPTPITAAVEGVARFLGFDLPRNLQEPTRIVAVTCPGLPASSGLSNAIMAARTPVSKPFVIPGMSASGSDEMDIKTLAATPSLVGYFTANSNTAENAIIFNIPVNPRFCPVIPGGDAGAPLVHPTHLSKAVTPFALWRGSIRYKFYVRCSDFQTLRVRVAFIPWEDATWTTSVPIENSYNMVIDINGANDFSLVVPFLSTRPMERQSVGRLVVQMVNPPGPAGDIAGTPVFFNVLASGCDDLEVAELSGDMLIPVTAFALAAQGGGVPRDDFAIGDFDPIGRGLSSTMLGSENPYLHDSYTHVSDLLRAPMPWFSNINGTALDHVLGLSPQGYGTWGAAYIGAALLPYLGVWSGGIAQDYNPTVLMQGVSVLGFRTLKHYGTPFAHVPNLFDHFSDCYKFSSGGHRLQVVTTPGSSPIVSVKQVPISPVSFGSLIGFGGTGAQSAFPILSGATMAPADITAWSNPEVPIVVEAGSGAVRVIEVEIPYRSMALFQTTGQSPPLPIITALAYAPGPWNSDTCQMTAISTSGSTAWSTVFRSAAEDFRFSFIKPLRPSILVGNRGGRGTPGVGGVSMIPSFPIVYNAFGMWGDILRT
jgi:hypothetical protein